MSQIYTTLTPRLIVADADRAFAFFRAVFAAEPEMVIKTPDGRLVHSELTVEGLRLSITEADGSQNVAPPDLGGSPVILTLHCDDPDAIASRALEAGAEMIFEIDDRYYGMRDGRFRDPMGHLWIVSKTIEHMSEEKLQQLTGGQ